MNAATNQPPIHPNRLGQLNWAGQVQQFLLRSHVGHPNEIASNSEIPVESRRAQFKLEKTVSEICTHQQSSEKQNA
jgi:hypothetical protein